MINYKLEEGELTQTCYLRSMKGRMLTSIAAGT
jgi:hypothetical protein